MLCFNLYMYIYMYIFKCKIFNINIYCTLLLLILFTKWIKLINLRKNVCPYFLKTEVAVKLFFTREMLLLSLCFAYTGGSVICALKVFIYNYKFISFDIKALSVSPSKLAWYMLKYNNIPIWSPVGYMGVANHG